jgi:hypothetical protein
MTKQALMQYELENRWVTAAGLTGSFSVSAIELVSGLVNTQARQVR